MPLKRISAVGKERRVSPPRWMPADKRRAVTLIARPIAKIAALLLVLVIVGCGEYPIDPREKLAFRKVKETLSAAHDESQSKTLLLEAAKQEFPIVVSYLVSHGVSVNSRDESSGRTALHEAAESGNPEVALRLANAGADVNARDSSGATPLLLAVAASRHIVIPVLLGAGADVSAADETGRTPIHVAADKGDIRTLDVLLQHGSDALTRTKLGESPLLFAVKSGNRAIVERLLEESADPNSASNTGALPLTEAIRIKRDDLVELLLAHGADPNGGDESGQPALHLAIRQKNAPLVELLADRGADVNANSRDGQSALAIAILESDPSLVMLMIQRGADPNSVADGQHTPLTLARRSGNRTIIDVLVERGAADAKAFPIQSPGLQPDALKRPNELAFLAPAANWPKDLHNIGFVCAGVHIADQSPTDTLAVPAIGGNHALDRAMEWWAKSIAKPANDGVTQILHLLAKQRLESNGLVGIPISVEKAGTLASLSEEQTEIDALLAMSVDVSIELIAGNYDIVTVRSKTNFVLFDRNGGVLAAGSGSKNKVIESTGYQQSYQGFNISTNVSYRMLDVMTTASCSALEIVDLRLFGVLHAAWMGADVKARLGESETAQDTLDIIAGEKGNKRQRMVWDNSKWESMAALTITNASDEPALLLVNGPVIRRIIAQPRYAPTVLLPPGSYDVAVVSSGAAPPRMSKAQKLARGERYRIPWNPILASGTQPAESPPRTDRDRIKGSWKAIAIESEGVTLPKERLQTDNLTIRFTDDKIQFDGTLLPLKSKEYKYNLGVSPTWKALDLGERETGFAYCVYEIHGDTLTLCMGNGCYPTELATGNLGGFFMCVLERIKDAQT